MKIVTTDEEYRPKNFTIHSFYGTETCFCWNENKLVVFPYEQNAKSTDSLTVLIAPARVKEVQCYSQRIFIVCSPCGVYKLSRDREFYVLSKTAIAVGKAYFEVLIPKAGFLYLDSKQDKSSKLIFQLSSEDKSNYGLSFFTLDTEHCNEEFKRALCRNYQPKKGRKTIEKGNEENLCIIADRRKLFLLSEESTVIFYNAEYPIVDVIPIIERATVNGLLLVLQPRNTFVAIRAVDNEQKISFQKVSLQAEVHAICAGSTGISVLWMIHANNTGTYYTQWTNREEQFTQKKISAHDIVSLYNYKSQSILGLTKFNEIIELCIDLPAEFTNPSDKSTEPANEFVRLKPNMFENTDSVIEEICRKAKELQGLNECLQNKRQELRNINLYTHKKMFRSPRMRANKTCNRSTLSVDFEEALPREFHVVVSVQTDCREIFSTKVIDNSNARTEVEIPADDTAQVQRVSLDLIALDGKDVPWFIMQEFTQENRGKKRLDLRKRQVFLTVKLNALTRAIADGNVDMKNLIEIKRSIRKELNVT